MSPEASEMSEREKLIHNEQRKLFAKFLNGVALAGFVILGIRGTIENMETVSVGEGSIQSAFAEYLVATFVVFALHLAARHQLKGLK